MGRNRLPLDERKEIITIRLEKKYIDAIYKKYNIKNKKQFNKKIVEILKNLL